MWSFQRRKARPGPKGTGIIFEVGRWSFWDDVLYPGLIRSEAQLAETALSGKEASAFRMARASADLISLGKRNKKAIAEVERYREKLSAYLLREADEFRVSPWIINSWEAQAARDKDEGIELLRAYIHILGYWGYPCDAREAVDPAGERFMAIISMRSWALTLLGRHSQRAYHNVRRPRGEAWLNYCIHRDDVLSLKGIPSKFMIDLRWARWTFDCAKSDIEVIKAG